MAYPTAAAAGCFRHVGFLYRTTEEYAATVARFARTGLAAGQPVFVAVPPGNARLIADALGRDARHVRFADMTRMGRNPAWIIPRVQDFIAGHAGHVRYVGEPAWSARTPSELREAIRHEALINLAFATANAEILCPYNTAELASAVIGDARRTHPFLLAAGGRHVSSQEHAEPSDLPASCSQPLPPPSHDAMYHTYRTDLSRVRALVLEQARAAGLTESRANDLVLAVSEVAANTLRHTRSAGRLAIWHDASEVVCEIHDEGRIGNPLAGRRRPEPDAPGGHGLWLVHQVCDLVELRSDESGTTIRMHMRISPPDGAG